MYDADAGGLVFAGPGKVRASADALAGAVEVREGAALELTAVPLPAVTALVVRAGSTLRIPADPTGLHEVLVGTGRLVVEDGAEVEDLAGNALTGRAMNGMFFEPGAALCWCGGTGAWSDAEGWYDVVTGLAGSWTNGLIAVFASAADVTNDCDGVEVKGFVFGGDVSVAGEGISLKTGFVEVPSNCIVTIAAPLACMDDVTKAGEGTLVLRGAQAMSGGLVARAGVLELDGVTAILVTNLVTGAGSCLALRGESVLSGASACSTIASGTVCLASEDAASLEVGRFVPVSQFVLPAGVTLRGACEYGFWRMTVNGRLECLTSPEMVITSWIDGTGTVRTAGLWTDTTSYARFSFCRVEMVPGAFQVLGNPGTGIMRRQYKNFLFDGVTFAPVGGDVHVTNSDLQEGLVTMCVNTNGVVFDTFDAAAGVGCTVSFDDPCATNLFFYGPGDVTKVGAGAVRFTVNDDLHEGRTIVQGGTYAVSTWSLTSGFHVTGEGSTVELSGVAYGGDVSLGSGSVLDLSAPAVTMVVTTNLQLAADAVLKVCVTPDGCDLIDVSEGECDLPINGEVVLDVTVQTGTPPGLYAAVAFPSAVAGRWTGRFTAPGGQQVGLEFTADRKILCVRVRRAATMLYIR
jgi:autotransporter-associated beta strand protein